MIAFAQYRVFDQLITQFDNVIIPNCCEMTRGFNEPIDRKWSNKCRKMLYCHIYASNREGLKIELTNIGQVVGIQYRAMYCCR